MTECPLCQFELENGPQDVFETDGHRYGCSNCGCFELSFESDVSLSTLREDRQRDESARDWHAS